MRIEKVFLFEDSQKVAMEVGIPLSSV